MLNAIIRFALRQRLLIIALGAEVVEYWPSGYLLDVRVEPDQLIALAAHNDVLWIERWTPPEAVFDIFRREFDAAFDEGGVCQLVMHPFVIGYRSRIWILERLIEHAKSRGKVWFPTHAALAAWVTEHSKP